VNHVGAWGEPLTGINSVNTPKINNFTLSTYEKENDFGIGVFDAHARVFDPVTPRFWSIDPLSELSRRFSPFVFSYNNPLRFTDPDGMIPRGLIDDLWNNSDENTTWTNNGDGSFGGDNGQTVQDDKGKSEEQRLSEIVTIKGQKYYKNTSNIFAAIGNKINNLFGGDPNYFVDKKPYDAVGDKMLQEYNAGAVGFIAGGVIGKVVGKGIGALASSGMSKVGFVSVGRWMSKAEYQIMIETGRMVEGAGGQTFVATGGANAFTAAAKGSVYAEFQIPASSLLQGGQANWFKVIGPSAGKAMQTALQKQGGELLPSIENLSPILQVK
jgi:RHS repeat-associated protein